MIRFRPVFLVGSVLTAALFFAAPSAFCQNSQSLLNKGQGMENHMFRSAVDTKGHFTVDATPILPHLAISLGLMLDFGFHNWFAVEHDGDRLFRDTKTNTYINSVLMFNLGLFDFLALGFQIPLVIPSGDAYDTEVVNKGTEPTSSEWSNNGGIGDIGAHLKLRWLRADKHAVGLGTVLQYQLPVSSKSEWLMSEPSGGALSAKMVLDSEPRSWYRFAVNVGARFPFGAKEKNELNADFGTPTNPTDRQLFKYGPMMTFGVGQSFSIWPSVLDFVFEVYGNQLFSGFGNGGYFSAEMDGGFKLFIERNSYLLAGYAHGLPFSGTDSRYGFQAFEHRLFIGFAFEPSMGDKDSDGIKDDVDQCPEDPEDRDDFEDSNGCPDPDNDRDGISDTEDDCPLVPEDRDNDADDDGCPDRGADDRDGDGILDDVDSCPDDPEDLDGFEDKEGCPDPDNDQDSILDKEDECPDNPEDLDGFEDKEGCPDPDNDKDRILDVNDKCPNEPETYNGKDDKDGCPDQGEVILTDTDIKILKKVYFEYDSAMIKEESFGILDAVAATIINNPQIDSLEVQGHADERGDDAYNLRLTSDRAASVVDYLVKKGVDRKKMRSAGYGEYCSVDPGHDEAAWEKNRRVEFKVLSIEGKPTGVETVCEAAKDKGIKVK